MYHWCGFYSPTIVIDRPGLQGLIQGVKILGDMPLCVCLCLFIFLFLYWGINGFVGWIVEFNFGVRCC